MRFIIFLLFVLFFQVSLVPAKGADKPVQINLSETNAYCPVFPEEKIDPSLAVDDQGKIVYLCCMGCVRKFQANPENYRSNLPQFNPDYRPPIVTGPESAKISPQEVQKVTEAFWTKTFEWLGRFHVLIVHFPIALYILAFVAEVCGMYSSSGAWRQIAGFNLFFATLSALCAAVFGWLLAQGWTGSPSLLETLERHRWLGISFTVLSVVSLGLWYIQGRRKVPFLRTAYMIVLFIGVILVGLTGHFGGTLVYGADYFKW